MNPAERISLSPGIRSVEPDLSVVIPSFNRRAALLRLLTSLECQQQTGFEVICVLDGSEDGSWEALVAADWSFPLVSIWQPNAGRSAARNRGVVEARAGLLLFLDDDMELEPDCLARHLDFHASHAGAVLVGQVPIRGNTPETDVQRFRRHLELGWTHRFPKVRAPFPPDVVYLTAGHFSIPRSLFDSLGGFEQQDSWGEDRLLAFQLRKLGVPLWYDPQAVAWHHDPLNFRRLVLRLRNEWLTPTHQLSRQKSIYFYFKKIIFLFFTTSDYVNLIDRSPVWLRVLPRRVRWLFYRCVLTALVYYYPQKPLEPNSHS